MSLKSGLKLKAIDPEHICIMDVGDFLEDLKEAILLTGMHPSDYYGQHGMPEDFFLRAIGELEPDVRSKIGDPYRSAETVPPHIDLVRKFKQHLTHFLNANKMELFEGSIQKIDLLNTLLVMRFKIK